MARVGELIHLKRNLKNWSWTSSPSALKYKEKNKKFWWNHDLWKP